MTADPARASQPSRSTPPGAARACKTPPPTSLNGSYRLPPCLLLRGVKTLAPFGPTEAQPRRPGWACRLDGRTVPAGIRRDDGEGFIHWVAFCHVWRAKLTQ